MRHTVVIIASLMVLAAMVGTVSANTIAYSTMIFQGSLADAGGGSDTATKVDYITVTRVNQTEYIWLEAEDAGSITPDFEIANDALASNGKYIWIPEGIGWNPKKGEVTYTIHTDYDGDYVFWGRAIAATSSDNSFFVQMDSGSEYLWTIALSENWQWDAVNHWGSGEEFNPEIDPVIFNLSAGDHILKRILINFGF